MADMSLDLADAEPGLADQRAFIGRLPGVLGALLWGLLVLLVAVSVTFVLSRIIPADPARMVAGLDAGPEQVEQVRENLGLNDPLPKQYVDYLGGLARGDFGDSLRTGQPVLNEMLSALPASLELIGVSFMFITAAGIVLGTLWAYWPVGPHRIPMRLFTVITSALPVFWVGLILQIVFAGKLGWFPVAGRLNYRAHGVDEVTGMGTLDAILALDPGAFVDAARALVLPVATMVLTSVSITTTLMRTSLTDQLDREYVRAARARGLSEFRVVVVEAARNALNPVVTMLGLQLGWSIGGIVIVEVLFSWSGIGLYTFSAFQTFDYNAIMAVAVLSTVSFLIINGIVGRLYGVLDPRTKEGR